MAIISPESWSAEQAVISNEEFARQIAYLRAIVELDAPGPESQEIVRSLGNLVTSVGIERPDSAQAWPVKNEGQELIAESKSRELPSQQQLVANYLSMFGNPKQAIGDKTELRSHQPSVFMGIAERLAAGPDDDGVIKFGLRAAPNVGKTMIAVRMAAAMGVGQVRDERGEPVRLLHLVPRMKIGRQTIGDERRGYARFAPGLSVGQYFDGVKELRDVTVMTYKSFENMPDEQFVQLIGQFQIGVADEVHRAYGPQTSERLRRFIERPGCIFMGMSATMEFDEERNLANGLGITELAADIGFREAIEAGVANGAEVLLVATDSKVEIAHSGRVSEADVRPLISDLPRNDLIVDIVQNMAEEGRMGIIRCARGDSSVHARMVAELAGSRQIVDPVTREQRSLRVRAVGNFQSADINERILAEYAAGAIDALTFTQYLIEGYDEERVDFVLDAEPTMSQVDVDQLFGRGMRFKERNTLYFQLVDTYTGRGKRVRTFLDTLNEEVYVPGKAIGQPGIVPDRRMPGGVEQSPYSKSPNRELRTAAWKYLGLPPHLRAAVESMSGRVVADLTVVRKSHEPVPEDWVPVDGLAINNSFSSPTVLKIIATRGIELRKGMRGRWYGPPNMERLLADVDEKVADPTFVPTRILRNELGVQDELFKKLTEELGITPIMMRTRTSTKKPGWHITAEDFNRMKLYVQQEYPPVNPETDVTVPQIAAELRRNGRQVRVIAGRLKIPMYARFNDRRKETFCMTPAQAARVREELGVLLPDNAVSISQLAERTGVETGAIKEAVIQSPQATALQAGILKGGVRVEWLNAEEAEEFLAWHKSNPIVNR